MKTNHLRKFTHLLTTTFVLPVMLFCLLSFTVREDDLSLNRHGAESTAIGPLNTSHDLTTNFNIVMSEKALVAKGEKEARIKPLPMDRMRDDWNKILDRLPGSCDAHTQ